jgi:transcriptional regulator with XRE-family HTH domain
MNLDSILIKIGANIKAQRELQNMPQQILAAKCNFEKANMSRIEAGRTNFTILTLYKISKALDIPLSSLLDLEE